MKKISAVWAMMALICLSSGAVLVVSSDITGTWVGETEVPDAMEADKLTMVISKKEGKYQGIISDTLGYASETEGDNFVLNENELSFSFDISDGYEVQVIYIKLKVDGESMTGYWENEAGEGAEISLVKQK